MPSDFMILAIFRDKRNQYALYERVQRVYTGCLARIRGALFSITVKRTNG